MSSADQREEVQRILQSAQFRRAPKLQRFLELVCDYHFQDRSAEINEFTIATQAFGKGPDFEPSEDSLVRVQAREIRRRLREYYQGEGKASRLILDIPIGRLRSGVHLARRRQPPAARRAPSLRSAWLILTGTVLACAALLIAADHERRLLIRARLPRPGTVNALSAPIAGLWNRFLDSDVPTLLVVSNPDVGECADTETGRHRLPGRIHRDG